MNDVDPTPEHLDPAEKERSLCLGKGKYRVRRGTFVATGFDTFYEAYMYALNRFCSEDFLVEKKGW